MIDMVKEVLMSLLKYPDKNLHVLLSDLTPPSSLPSLPLFNPWDSPVSIVPLVYR